MTGPTSQAAANNSAVLPLMTAIFVLGGCGVLGRRELHYFAFGNGGRSRGKNIERAQRADLDHHAKRLAEQEIADQHAGLIAPQHPRGQLAAPQFAFIDHVVMQQRRGVHEFDRGGELDMAVAGIAGEAGHRQCQHRAETFAARGNQVVGDLGNHGDFRPRPRQDRGVDPLHIGGDEPDQRIYRCVRAFEGYNNRHAGLHFWPIRTILIYNRKCRLGRQGQVVVDSRRRWRFRAEHALGLDPWWVPVAFKKSR